MSSLQELMVVCTVYPKKYAHGFCFAVLCCGYTLTDFPISIRLTSLALWQSNDCPSASKATLMNMDKYFMWIHNERLHNHNKAKHNTTVCIFLGIYCMGVEDELGTQSVILFFNHAIRRHWLDSVAQDDFVQITSTCFNVCHKQLWITGAFPAQRPVTRSFVFFDLPLE